MAKRRTNETHTADVEEMKSITSFDEYTHVKTQTVFGPILWSRNNLLTKARPQTVVVITI